jgi:hypothetical protein
LKRQRIKKKLLKRSKRSQGPAQSASASPVF